MGATTYIIVSLILPLQMTGQSHPYTYPDGIYVTLDCWKVKPMPVKLYRKKYACITERPIVGITGVASVSEIHHVPDNYSVFRITLTNEAYSTLKATASQMANNLFAFVVKNELIFTFNIDLMKFNTIIEVKGNYRNKDLILFYKELLGIVKDNAGH